MEIVTEVGAVMKIRYQIGEVMAIEEHLGEVFRMIVKMEWLVKMDKNMG